MLQNTPLIQTVDDKQLFFSSVAFCHINVVVSQCQDGSRAVEREREGASERGLESERERGIIYYRAEVFIRAPTVYRQLVFELRAEVGEQQGRDPQ